MRARCAASVCLFTDAVRIVTVIVSLTRKRFTGREQKLKHFEIDVDIESDLVPSAQ